MTVNCLVNGESASIPATSVLAAFVADASTSQLTQELRQKVKEVVIDWIGVTVGALNNAESTKPIYDSILQLQGGEVKGKHTCTVLGRGEPHFLPQYAGLLNATLSHSLDFDDTYIEGTLHSGCTAVSAALTQAEMKAPEVSTEQFMLAIAVGYEITCRIGRELGFEAYHRGFHNTGTAGIFGAVAAIAVLRHLPVKTIEMAWGLAGSKAAGSMQYLDNGSWNKRLHPGFAVHDAFICVSLAEGGVIGATRSIEGKNGFLKAYSPNENKDLNRLTKDLGYKWDWLDNALKPYPACRMTHTLIELAGKVHTEYVAKYGKTITAAELEKITLSIPESNFILVGDPKSNKIHPINVVDAQFSAYFQVANALLYGSPSGLQGYKRLQDHAIHEVCAKTTVLPDEKVRGFPGRIRLLWKNGKEEERYQEYALGEVQHPFIRQRVEEKYFALVSPVIGESKAKKILDYIDELESGSTKDLIELLQ